MGKEKEKELQWKVHFIVPGGVFVIYQKTFDRGVQ